MKISTSAMPVLLLALAVGGGCAIADKSDRFGADLDLGVGGFLGEFVDLRLKASVGFSKTCKEKEDGDDTLESMARSGASRPRGFL